jgi:TolA-binding protein
VDARRILRSWVVAIILMAGWAVLPVSAADLPQKLADEKALDTAFEMFKDGQYALAETNFSNFLTTYTNSTHRAYAILYLAISRLDQTNSAGAMELLQNSFSSAGELQPQYVFWIAKARLSQKDFMAAAIGFANVARIASSPQRLEAAYDEALTYSEMTNWPYVINLLQATNRVFHIAAALEPESSFTAMGTLLLGEALLNENRPVEAEKATRALDSASLKFDLAWRRQYLLCRIKLAAGHGDDALDATTNLLALASGLAHRAASIFLQGQILEDMRRPADALAAYETNLVDGVPAEEQRRALAKTVELTVALNPLGEAIQSLENLIVLHPQTPGVDLAHVGLGELYLKAYGNPAAAQTGTNGVALAIANPLDSALTNFNIVIRDFTNSQWLPKAHLDRGWCYWCQGNVADAKKDFEAAAQGLPYSEDQAVAIFKWGDSQFAEHNYAGAVSNYTQLLIRYDTMPSVTNNLFDQALYQIVEAKLNLHDDEGAGAAAQKILRWFPGSYLGEGGRFLMGQSISNSQARQVFMDLLKRSPNSPIAPEVEFAIARTYDHEGEWSTALRGYDNWMTNHPGNRLLPEVEFYQALATAKEGMETNALMKFTNFVARFPSNSLAPWAKNWVADYYYKQQDYPSAEKSYQELYQKFPNAGDLAYQGRYWAGRAALANQELADARIYFSALVSDTNTPTALEQKGFFALADTAFQQFLANPSNLTNLNDAIAAVSKLTNSAPTNAIAVEAFGRLGDYYMQYADLKSDTNVYPEVIQMYSTILSFPATAATVSARSQAEVGLGIVAEKEHLPQMALMHYSRVLYGDPENFDPYWVETAGRHMAQICEEQQKWDQAVNAYKRVLDAVPSLAPVLKEKIATDERRAEASHN